MIELLCGIGCGMLIVGAGIALMVAGLWREFFGRRHR